MKDASMVSYRDYVAGWLDSSVRDFLGLLPPNVKSTKYALITCLDSNLDPCSLLDKSPELRRLAGQARPLGNGLVVPTRLLLGLDTRSQLFFGFDEVWLFPTEQLQAKPDSACLVGPDRLDQVKLDKVGAWMSRNACTLGLGDGAGLNFITKARGLVKYLLGHSIAQPPPAVEPFETAESA
jgi:hypothetical protein